MSEVVQHIGNVYELAKLLCFSHLLLIPVLKIPQRASEVFFFSTEHRMIVMLVGLGNSHVNHLGVFSLKCVGSISHMTVAPVAL